MEATHLDLLREVAEIFTAHKERILHNWMENIQQAQIIHDPQEFEYFNYGFEKLVHDFVRYLSKGELEQYYHENAQMAAKIAYNDISFSKFVEAFHLFEDSYEELLLHALHEKDILPYIEVIDRIHHKTIAIIAEVYFELHDNTIFALAKLAELRDANIGYHLERTREYAAILAKQLYLGEEFVRQISRVGPLHDIGKIAIPDNILLKPGGLTPEEFEIMKTHTTIGAKTISEIIGVQELNRGYLKMAYDIALYHHEKYNGTGYPEGLQGEAIPLAARIFALVDAYDAIVSKRSYKAPVPHAEAVLRINMDAGTHFDPQIVTAFLAVQRVFKQVSEQYQDE